MKYTPWKCPACGEHADGTLETVTGKALLNFDADGNAEYGGETEIFWDEQKTVRDEAGPVTLICANGHDWQAEQDDDPPAIRGRSECEECVRSYGPHFRGPCVH